MEYAIKRLKEIAVNGFGHCKSKEIPEARRLEAKKYYDELMLAAEVLENHYRLSGIRPESDNSQFKPSHEAITWAGEMYGIDRLSKRTAVCQCTGCTGTYHDVLDGKRKCKECKKPLLAD